MEGPSGRQILRFLGWVLVFLGILVGVVALMSWLALGRSVTGGVAVGVALVLLGVLAPRVGYRWFDAALFLIPLYGQVVFLPRMLWRGAEMPTRRRRERAERDRMREEARLLAAFLFGDRSRTGPARSRPAAQMAAGPAGPTARRAPPGPPGRRGPEGPPQSPSIGLLLGMEPSARPGQDGPEGPDRGGPREGSAAGREAEGPAGGSPPEPATGRESRLLAWGLVVLVVLLAWALGATILGTLQLSDLRDRTGRLDAELREARAELEGLDMELGAVRRELGRLGQQLPPDIPALVDEAVRSVVTVEVVGFGFGSGFAVEADDLPSGFRTAIITNEHVIRPAIRRRAQVRITQGGRMWVARLGRWDRANDLALLYMKGKLSPLPWASEKGHGPRVGELVVAVGVEGTAALGVISRLLSDTVATDAEIHPGDSGGPLLNRYGEVVGVGAFSLRGIGFAVRVERACVKLLAC